MHIKADRELDFQFVGIVKSATILFYQFRIQNDFCWLTIRNPVRNGYNRQYIHFMMWNSFNVKCKVFHSVIFAWIWMSFDFANTTERALSFDCVLHYLLKLLSWHTSISNYIQTNNSISLHTISIYCIRFTCLFICPRNGSAVLRFTWHVALLFLVFFMRSFWFNIEKRLFCHCLFYQQSQYTHI